MGSDGHLARLRDALSAEEAHQRAAHRERIALPHPDRVAVGVAWPTLLVEHVERIGWGGTRLLLRAPSGVVLHEAIDAGEPVTVAPVGVEPDEGAPGWVEGVDRRAAEVRCSGDVDLEGPVEVCMRFDPTTFRRYRDALEAAEAHDSPLKAALLGRGAIAEVHPEVPDWPRLNPAQARAATHVWTTRPLGLVHGPPGTGKTHLIVALLQAWAAAGDRPWALADSNAAVDHLAVRAARAGLDVVRMGHTARIGSAATTLSLHHRIHHGPWAKALKVLERDLAKARGDTSREGRRAFGVLRGERRKLLETARASLLAGADVIAVTLGTLARVAPDLPSPRVAIVDEATQAIEPAVWGAVPHVEQLVLVGDPEQLGPVVTHPGNPLQRSLFTRLLTPGEGPEALELPMLEVQHRMHADVQALVADVYGPAYRPHPSVAAHRLGDLPGVAETPLTTRTTLFVDTAGGGLAEGLDPRTRSRFNEGEAALVAHVVGELLDAGVPAGDIGVIAPYSAQVARLDAVLPGEVEVATVNAFQGREKEVIVTSWVRSNELGELGFVADGRRLTVALTRPRRLWVGVGDGATLSTDDRFAALLDHLGATGALESVWTEPWSAVAGLS